MAGLAAERLAVRRHGDRALAPVVRNGALLLRPPERSPGAVDTKSFVKSISFVICDLLKNFILTCPIVT